MECAAFLELWIVRHVVRSSMMKHDDVIKRGEFERNVVSTSGGDLSVSLSLSLSPILVLEQVRLCGMWSFVFFFD